VSVQPPWVSQIRQVSVMTARRPWAHSSETDQSRLHNSVPGLTSVTPIVKCSADDGLTSESCHALSLCHSRLKSLTAT
jgi:hypothetical protein